MGLCRSCVYFSNGLCMVAKKFASCEGDNVFMSLCKGRWFYALSLAGKGSGSSLVLEGSLTAARDPPLETGERKE